MTEAVTEYKTESVLVCGVNKYRELEEKYIQESSCDENMGFQIPVINGREVYLNFDLPKNKMVGMPKDMAQEFCMHTSYMKFTKRSYWFKLAIKEKWQSIKAWFKR